MFPQPYQLRLMAVSDIDAVMRVEKLVYPFPWTSGNFHDCLNSGYYACVLEDAHRLIGYAVMSMAAGEAHVLNICIHPELQSRGLGRALLRSLEDIARANDIDMLLLEVRESNHIAIKLYESMGFNELGARKNYYPSHAGREHAIVMARQLV